MIERETVVFRRAIVKFNDGNGALLCNRCHTIIANGIRHKDVEHYCDECEKLTVGNGFHSSDQKQV
jgi:hypothetical protein